MALPVGARTRRSIALTAIAAAAIAGVTLAGRVACGGAREDPGATPFARSGANRDVDPPAATDDASARARRTIDPVRSRSGATDPDGDENDALAGPAARRATLRVTADDGVPVEGAEVFLHRRLTRQLQGNGPGPGPGDEPRPVGSTDLEGLISFPLADTMTAAVHLPDGRLGVTLVQPGEGNHTYVRGPLRSMEVTSPEGTPVADRAFPLAWSDGGRHAGLFVRTGPAGRARIPSGGGHLTLARSAPRLLLASVSTGVATDLDPTEAPEGRFSAHLDLRQDEVEVRVVAIDEERTLRLLDAASGAGLTGDVYLFRQQRRTDGEWFAARTDRTTRVQDGVLAVGSWFTGPSPAASIREERRWITMAGRAPHAVMGGADLDGVTLMLEPAPARRILTVGQDGGPVSRSGSVIIGGNVCIRLETDADGLTPPLPWEPGTGWEVWFAGLHVSKEILSAERMAEGPVVTVGPAIELGAIRVTGVPEGAPPLFASCRQAELVPGVPAPDVEGAVDFPSLPVKLAAVGPRAWAREFISRRHRLMGDRTRDPFPVVQVRPGVTVEVPWRDEWGDPGPLTGTVECAAHDPGELAVLPVYGHQGGRLYFAPHGRWTYLDGAGGFTLPAGEPTPVSLLVARFEHGTFGRRPEVLDSQPFENGARIEVRLTSFELQPLARPDAFEEIRVLLERDHRLLAAPVEVLPVVRRWRWDGRSPLGTSGLPADVNGLRLMLDAEGERLDLPLRPGEHNILKIDEAGLGRR